MSIRIEYDQKKADLKKAGDKYFAALKSTEIQQQLRERILKMAESGKEPLPSILAELESPATDPYETVKLTAIEFDKLSRELAVLGEKLHRN